MIISYGDFCPTLPGIHPLWHSQFIETAWQAFGCISRILYCVSKVYLGTWQPKRLKISHSGYEKQSNTWKLTSRNLRLGAMNKLQLQNSDVTVKTNLYVSVHSLSKYGLSWKYFKYLMQGTPVSQKIVGTHMQPTAQLMGNKPICKQEMSGWKALGWKSEWRAQSLTGEAAHVVQSGKLFPLKWCVCWSSNLQKVGKQHWRDLGCDFPEKQGLIQRPLSSRYWRTERKEECNWNVIIRRKTAQKSGRS